jgi:hypothetical protein
MAGLAENPFAILTAIAAPAVLTNASSLLLLGTGNRIGRVVDRTRVVVSIVTGLKPQTQEYDMYTRQLDRLAIRSKLLMRAMRILYVSLASFAASALVAVVGSSLVAFGQSTVAEVTAMVGLVFGTLGVGGMMAGCAFMVRETQFAMENLTEEAEFAHQLFHVSAKPDQNSDPS